MSSDDGYILRRNEKGKFVLQHYFASADEYPPIDSEYALQFDTLEDAILKYAELDENTAWPSEYGLTTKINQTSPQEKSVMQTTKYRRKEFNVDVVDITEENLEEAARWCKGTIRSDETSKRYILVPVQNAINERQTKAYAGDHILFARNGYKVYTHKAFIASFEPVEGLEELAVAHNVFEEHQETKVS